MHIQVLHGSVAEVDADAVIVNLFEGIKAPGGATGAVDHATGGMISRLIGTLSFGGEIGKTFTFHTERLGSLDGHKVTKVVVVGLGNPSDFDDDTVRRVSASAVKAALGPGVKRIATILHGAGIGGLDPARAAGALTEGSLLAAYTYAPYKSKAPKTDAAESLLVVEFDAAKLRAIEAGIERGRVMAESTNFARDLVNTPPNDMKPQHLADAAMAMAKETGLICRVLGSKDLVEMGMGGILGVSQGSDAEPKLLLLGYGVDPATEEPPRLALVGKGITFDSGGLSIKTASGMETMKEDMAGAAAVLGAMRALALLGEPASVLGVVPCVENMISGRAYRPGDVLRTMSGKTMEIINTDAEGRIILADAVAYAASRRSGAIVDVATLTGAVEVALGNVYTGGLSNSDELWRRLEAAAERTGERFWRFPTHSDYKEQYESEIADLKNSGGRLAGAITGGLIIGEFSGDTPWMHLDIAGTASALRARPGAPKGATGVAVRTLAELALSLSTDSTPSPRLV